MRNLFYLLFTLTYLLNYAGAYEGDVDTPSAMVSFQGIPSCYVNGCVNVITGEYIEAETDIISNGIEPLYYQRFYRSSLASKNNKATCDSGWTDSRRQLLKESAFLRDSKKFKNLFWNDSNNYFQYFTLAESNGCNTLLKNEKWNRSCFPDREQLKSGFTNCSLSGRNNIKNLRMDSEPEHWIVNSGDGRKKYYKFKFGNEKECHYLIKELLPNG